MNYEVSFKNNTYAIKGDNKNNNIEQHHKESTNTNNIKVRNEITKLRKQIIIKYQN